MSTLTGSPLSLTKAAPADIVDVTQHLANNFQAINDWAAGIVPVALIPNATQTTVIPSGNLYTAYPVGSSIMRITSADITLDPNWAVDAGATSCEVLTFCSSDRAIQFWMRATTQYHAMYVRYMSTTNNPWYKIGGEDLYGVNGVNTGIIPVNQWTKVACSTGEVQAGVDIVTASAGSPSTAGLLLKLGGVYYIEASATWDGGVGAGIRYLGVDDLTGAGPTGLNQGLQSTSGTEACIQNLSFTRKFSPSTTIGMWARHNNTGGLGISTRRLFARRVSDSVI